jgi:Fe-S cluster biogenesis protein NfuA
MERPFTVGAHAPSMSADAQDGDDLKERVENFLRRNFPQIQMHGGSAAVQDIDREEGSVRIMLGGACSGCGISPMTIQAIKSRMRKEIPEIETVHADTGMGGGHSTGSGRDGGIGAPSSDSGFPGDDGDDDEGPQAPF